MRICSTFSLLLLTFIIFLAVGAVSETVQSGWYACEYPSMGCDMLVGGSVLELDVLAMTTAANGAGNTTATAILIAPRLNMSSIVVSCTPGLYPTGVSLDLSIWGMVATGDDGGGAVVRVVGTLPPGSRIVLDGTDYFPTAMSSTVLLRTEGASELTPSTMLHLLNTTVVIVTTWNGTLGLVELGYEQATYTMSATHIAITNTTLTAVECGPQDTFDIALLRFNGTGDGLTLKDGAAVHILNSNMWATTVLEHELTMAVGNLGSGNLSIHTGSSLAVSSTSISLQATNATKLTAAVIFCGPLTISSSTLSITSTTISWLSDSLMSKIAIHILYVQYGLLVVTNKSILTLHNTNVAFEGGVDALYTAVWCAIGPIHVLGGSSLMVSDHDLSVRHVRSSLTKSLSISLVSATLEVCIEDMSTLGLYNTFYVVDSNSLDNAMDVALTPLLLKHFMRISSHSTVSMTNTSVLCPTHMLSRFTLAQVDADFQTVSVTNSSTLQISYLEVITIDTDLYNVLLRSVLVDVLNVDSNSSISVMDVNATFHTHNTTMSTASSYYAVYTNQLHMSDTSSLVVQNTTSDFHPTTNRTDSFSAVLTLVYVVGINQPALSLFNGCSIRISNGHLTLNDMQSGRLLALQHEGSAVIDGSAVKISNMTVSAESIQDLTVAMWYTSAGSLVISNNSIFALSGISVTNVVDGTGGSITVCQCVYTLLVQKSTLSISENYIQSKISVVALMGNTLEIGDGSDVSVGGNTISGADIVLVSSSYFKLIRNSNIEVFNNDVTAVCLMMLIDANRGLTVVDDSSFLVVSNNIRVIEAHNGLRQFFLVFATIEMLANRSLLEVRSNVIISVVPQALASITYWLYLQDGIVDNGSVISHQGNYVNLQVLEVAEDAITEQNILVYLLNTVLTNNANILVHNNSAHYDVTTTVPTNAVVLFAHIYASAYLSGNSSLRTSQLTTILRVNNERGVIVLPIILFGVILDSSVISISDSTLAAVSIHANETSYTQIPSGLMLLELILRNGSSVEITRNSATLNSSKVIQFFGVHAYFAINESSVVSISKNMFCVEDVSTNTSLTEDYIGILLEVVHNGTIDVNTTPVRLSSNTIHISAPHISNEKTLSFGCLSELSSVCESSIAGSFTGAILVRLYHIYPLATYPAPSVAPLLLISGNVINQTTLVPTGNVSVGGVAVLLNSSLSATPQPILFTSISNVVIGPYVESFMVGTIDGFMLRACNDMLNDRTCSRAVLPCYNLPGSGSRNATDVCTQTATPTASLHSTPTFTVSINSTISRNLHTPTNSHVKTNTIPTITITSAHTLSHAAITPTVSNQPAPPLIPSPTATLPLCVPDCSTITVANISGAHVQPTNGSNCPLVVAMDRTGVSVPVTVVGWSTTITNGAVSVENSELVGNLLSFALTSASDSLLEATGTVVMGGAVPLNMCIPNPTFPHGGRPWVHVAVAPPPGVLSEGEITSVIVVSAAAAAGVSDAMVVAVLGMTPCAPGGKDAGVKDNIRALVLTATTLTCNGAIQGALAAMGGVSVISILAVVVYRSIKGGSWISAAASVRCPSMLLLTYTVMQMGFVVCGGLLTSGVVEGSFELGVFGLLLGLSHPLVFVTMAELVVSRRCMQLGRTAIAPKGVFGNAVTAYLMPRFELDVEMYPISRAFTHVVGKHRVYSSGWAAMTGAPAVIMLLCTIASGPLCLPLYAIASALFGALGGLVLVFRPHRLVWSNYVQGFAHLLNAVLLALAARVGHEPDDMTARDGVVAVSMLQVGLSAARFAHMLLVMLLTRLFKKKWLVAVDYDGDKIHKASSSTPEDPLISQDEDRGIIRPVFEHRGRIWRTGTHDMAGSSGGSHLQIEMLAEHAAEIATGARERPTDADDTNDHDDDIQRDLHSMPSNSQTPSSSSSSISLDIDLHATNVDLPVLDNSTSSETLELDDLNVL